MKGDQNGCSKRKSNVREKFRRKSFGATAHPSFRGSSGKGTCLRTARATRTAARGASGASAVSTAPRRRSRSSPGASKSASLSNHFSAATQVRRHRNFAEQNFVCVCVCVCVCAHKSGPNWGWGDGTTFVQNGQGWSHPPSILVFFSMGRQVPWILPRYGRSGPPQWVGIELCQMCRLQCFALVVGFPPY